MHVFRIRFILIASFICSLFAIPSVTLGASAWTDAKVLEVKNITFQYPEPTTTPFQDSDVRGASTIKLSAPIACNWEKQEFILPAGNKDALAIALSALATGNTVRVGIQTDKHFNGYCPVYYIILKNN